MAVRPSWRPIIIRHRAWMIMVYWPKPAIFTVTWQQFVRFYWRIFFLGDFAGFSSAILLDFPFFFKIFLNENLSKVFQSNVKDTCWIFALSLTGLYSVYAFTFPSDYYCTIHR
jgi:hypothetical protein